MIKSNIVKVFDKFTSIIAKFVSRSKIENKVLHVSYNVHIAINTKTILNNNGVNAHYMSIGKFNGHESDFHISLSKNPLIRVYQELKAFRIISKYKVVHTHFGLMPSRTGWEYKLLKKRGIKVVYHARGCNSRDWQKNFKLQPDPLKNICFDCDYNKVPCSNYIGNIRRTNALKVSDRVIATTPDLIDFLPSGAEHMPFFSPDVESEEWRPFDFSNGVNIIHVTNHPGIEGTSEIVKAIDELKKEGLKINFEFLQNVPHHEYISKLKNAHLNIGKMKMGYYANAQIESMAHGVPAITYIRDEYLNSKLVDSALIICNLHTLKQTIRDYVNNKDMILDKRSKCKDTISLLHNNKALSKQYSRIYNSF
tara:strand:- start:128177 stop:129274 length:1098 start_codon:yes stop_codon:yes gene_type:complete